LCGVSHRCDNGAHHCAKKCLQQWDQLKALGLARVAAGLLALEVHTLSRLWLDGGGQVQPLLLVLAQGALLVDPRVQLLQPHIARLQFVVIVERRIEDFHSQLKRALQRAPNDSGALVSMAMRVRRIRPVMKSTRAMLSEFLDFDDQRRDPHQLLRNIGLARHTGVQAIPHNDHAAWSLAAKIAYRHDREMQFIDCSHITRKASDNDQSSLDLGRLQPTMLHQHLH
jgi:hypothetical protein